MMVPYMLPCTVKLEIEYYKAGEDTSPFKEWFDNLEINATKKVTAAIKGYCSSPRILADYCKRKEAEDGLNR